jgi:hypothetical protein
MILGLALFVGQAFLYNGVTFDLGTLLHTFYGLASGVVPVFIVIYALGNFLGRSRWAGCSTTVWRSQRGSWACGWCWPSRCWPVIPQLANT